jgi:hypothetical protein
MYFDKSQHISHEETTPAHDQLGMKFEPGLQVTRKTTTGAFDSLQRSLSNLSSQMISVSRTGPAA